MMTVDEMIRQKNKLGLTYAQIASLSGIPVGTVQKLLGRITTSPRYDTLLALEKVLGSESDPNILKEDEPTFGEKEQYTSNKKPGEYTLDDYYALPDDQRVELIDGVFYDMSAPSTIHQIISLNMSIQIKRFIDKSKGNCMVFIAPCDVQLDMDNKTMVQPDVMIICKKDKIVKKNIFGCPDFIVEVLSSSTKKKDMALKLAKYENAGVKEYWMVDPDKLKIIVYDFAHDYDVSIYGFEDKVPVGLYDGKLQIDFKPILDEISFLL